MSSGVVPIIVVIVNHGNVELLLRTLRSLAEAEMPEGFCGIIVVENGAEHGAKQALHGLPSHLRIRYLYEPSHSKCVALNRALEGLNRELVIFLDDDVRVSPKILTVYGEAAKKGEGNYFGGPVSCDYEKMPEEWLRPFLPPSALGMEVGNYDVVGKNQFFLGFNWAAFASDLRSAGGFDERIGPGRRVSGGDESLMQFHLGELGCHAHYVADSRVWHWVPSERSSSAWVLRRAAPSGYMAGAFASDYATRQNARLGFLRSLRKALVRIRGRVDVVEMGRFSDRGRWMYRYVYTYMQGFLEGYRGELVAPLYGRQVRNREERRVG